MERTPRCQKVNTLVISSKQWEQIDPIKPAKNQSAENIYVQENYESVLKENGSRSVRTAILIAKKEWTSLIDCLKQQFISQAELEASSYTKKLATYHRYRRKHHFDREIEPEFWLRLTTSEKQRFTDAPEDEPDKYLAKLELYHRSLQQASKRVTEGGKSVKKYQKKRKNRVAKPAIVAVRHSSIQGLKKTHTRWIY
ncbi:hypothetical protein BJV82DRAFT_669442 [Fennellomyces sp. T-0311]|nr:hypothetical protein BJV82DRAFT_669442 [Fennellomyces sp. T-0311]